MMLYPVLLYNDATSGVPKHTYSTGTKLYCMIRRTIGSDPDATDKTKVTSNFEIVVRIDNTVYTVEDKIVWNGFAMKIKNIEQIDIWYQKLICFSEY